MTPTEFWQNFKLGEEQEIASNFIYDGLRNLHDMETLSYETEIFPVLYNLSVGIERLFKVAIVLLEFNDNTEITRFTNSLKTHDHTALLQRLRKSTGLVFDSAHEDLLKLLSIFYKTHRYDRFNFHSIESLSKDKKALHKFLYKYLQIDTTEKLPIFGVENSSLIKNFIGETVKRITKDIYRVIENAATSKNLYTYEISSSGSKAARILLGDDPIVFEIDETALIESFIFLMNTKDSSLSDFIRTIDPLPLDPAFSKDYLLALLHKRSDKSQMIIDEVESRYEDLENLKDRIETIMLIKDPHLDL